ncbi:metal ABC transporter substrate-binding protein [Solicola gregarius]|uniref:Metal ABC transporter substrate-binding protein n=1 Tax=Solicola gregarius TaxID=2908642 RepID=A0AA46YKH5_9ACTN|nr:metal ABC transporter substrate-binding protein [Solicola gregarius]UYM05775.1 metal ABC transporter substrate-binding protein [Solicola gregarius]
MESSYAIPLPLLLAAVAPVLLLTACGGDADSASGTRVVASFYPFAYVAEQVGGDAVDVENLTSPGAEPHDIELAPKQVAAVQDADLAIFETGFQPAVDDAVDQADLSDDARLDVADVVTLHEAEEGEHEHEGEEGHDHGSLDPHVWLDPNNMIAITEAAADHLSDADPDHAKEFAKNAKAFTDELRGLDRAYEKGLANCERSTIVTSHDAFGYLAARYGLEQVGIAGLDPSTEPSPEQLADITDLVREDGITTIFTEELVSPAVAETVADETGADVATLDPIEGLSDDTADETYVSLMKQNLDALMEANGCS